MIETINIFESGSKLAVTYLTMYKMNTKETRRLATANTLTRALQAKAMDAPERVVRDSVRR